MPSYFYANGDKTEGPFDTIELAAQIRYANITPDTLVRRDGEEVWLPLRDLAEFASLEGIPVETIARHLEEKDSPRPSPLAPAQIRSTLADLKSIAILVGGAVAVLVVLALFQQGNSSAGPKVTYVDAPAPPAWITTMGDGFSIESPVLLNRETTTSDINAESYRSSTANVNYNVDLYRIPASLPTTYYPQLINAARDKTVRTKGRTATAQHFIQANGRNGVDVFFTDEDGGVKFEGGCRILAGSGRLAIAAIIMKVGTLPPDSIPRYLNSFQVP